MSLSQEWNERLMGEYGEYVSTDSMMVNHQPNPNDEVVKCVVVGDSGVGKTCLVCAWACNATYDLKKLVKTHVATVWAIDHYQRDREILERSWCEVDGVRVSLRLWDTFGYHDKDRGFAYRGADVILLCFSTVRPSSLRNVRTIWYPEIRRFCPTTPIVLVGTQTDLRYLYNEDNYLKMEKGLMYRCISEKDIVTPGMGHDIAKDIGAPFYESSVLTRFGVSDVFINSVRAALIERRKLKFWNTQLRKVQRPLIQPPMALPTPSLPAVTHTPPPHPLGSRLACLQCEGLECDVRLVAGGVSVEAHAIVLAMACQLFEELFSCPDFRFHRFGAGIAAGMGGGGGSLLSSPTSGVHPGVGLVDMGVDNDPFKHQSVTSDDRCLLDNEVASSPNNNTILASDPDDLVMGLTLTPDLDPAVYPVRVRFSHPAVECVEVERGGQVVVTLHPDITPLTLRVLLTFLYTDRFSPQMTGSVKEVKRVAELLGLREFLAGVNSYVMGDVYMSGQLEKQMSLTRQARLHTLALSRDNFLTDVVFEVDDGRVSAHKVLLMAGCEMMNAMFSNSFLESSADVVSFPGINCETFRTLVEYIYTGEATSLATADCLSLIETANRLCLPHLVSLTEAYVVSELQIMECKSSVEEAILLMEPAELHNATQLSAWCEKFLSIHYKEATQQHSKLFRSLSKERQEAIENSRWPPVWYLKEIERYDRQTHDRCSHPAQRQRQDYNRCFTGCLCFSRRARHRLNDPVDLPI